MEIKKALTFRASSIGDCLMGKYFLDNIHAQFPKAKLGIVVGSRGAMIRDLLSSAPYIEVIEANRRNPVRLWKLWRAFRASDVVVTQYAGKHGGTFGMASKLAARALARRGGLIGFRDASRFNGLLYDQLLPVNPEAAVAEHERACVRAAGVFVSIPYPRLESKPNPSVLSKFQLAENRYVVAHFFAGSAKRGISPEKAHELLIEFRKNDADTLLVISGGASDLAQAAAIADGVPNCMMIAGRATLSEMIQIVGSSRGVLSLDTGMAHIAAQLGRPVIVLRTCLGPNWWFPEQYGPGIPSAQFSREDFCTPHVTKEYPDCIDKIDVTKIVMAAHNFPTPDYNSNLRS